MDKMIYETFLEIKFWVLVIVGAAVVISFIWDAIAYFTRRG